MELRNLAQTGALRELAKEDDLIRLVNEKAEESLHLDFKESRALARSDHHKKELAKDVAAMATAEGGLLVYGIVEDKKSHTAAALDDGCDPAEVSKETIEHVIDSRVSPRVEGLRIVPIELTSRSKGRFAFCVYVPASERAPHMADHRYYTRMNFQSVPMDDYLVRDVMLRRRVARLVIVYHVEVVGTRGCMLRFGAKNIGFVGAEDLYFELEFDPERVCWHDKPPEAFEPVVHIVPPDIERKTHLMTYQQVSGAPVGRGTSGYRNLPPVLYPGVTVPFQELALHVRPDAVAGEEIHARLFARDMPVVARTFEVSQFLAGLKLKSAALHLATSADHSTDWLTAGELIGDAKKLLLPFHFDTPEVLQAWVVIQDIPRLVSPGTSEYDSIRHESKGLAERAAQWLLPE